MLLVLDPNTYATLPWTPVEARRGRVFCDIYQTDGNPFPGDPRGTLKRILAKVQQRGWTCNVGPEPEFYIFRTDSENRTIPLDYGSYFDLSSHQGYKVTRQIMTALENFGIDVETSHHEVGFGQYEIACHSSGMVDGG